VVAPASRAASFPLLKEVRVATLELRPLSTGEILDGALGAGAGAIAGGVDAAVTVRKEGFDLEVLSGQLGSRQEFKRA
jgi:hypothetical protein